MDVLPRQSILDRPSRRWYRDPVTPPPALRGRPGRALRRAVRRLVALVSVLVALAVLALVGTAALLDTSPDQVMVRVTELVDQVRAGRGP